MEILMIALFGVGVLIWHFFKKLRKDLHTLAEEFRAIEKAHLEDFIWEGAKGCYRAAMLRDYGQQMKALVEKLRNKNIILCVPEETKVGQ